VEELLGQGDSLSYDKIELCQLLVAVNSSSIIVVSNAVSVRINVIVKNAIELEKCLAIKTAR